MVKRVAFFLFLLMCLLAIAAVFGFWRILYTPTDMHDRVITTVSAPQSEQQIPTAPQISSESFTLTFVGDMNFDRYLRTVAERNGYAFLLQEDLRTLFASHACVIGNLEGPITTHVSVSQGSAIGAPNNYRFTFDPAVVTFLTDANFCAVNLGNNHIGNFGAEGTAATRAFLAEKGIAAFGDTGDDAPRFAIRTFHGVRVAFVNDNAFAASGHVRALSDVRESRTNADIVIAYTHWGAEYVTTANAVQRQSARELIDAGADVVIGSHPHVVQDVEEYKGKKIYYSLGNFIFDQYFQPETQRGLVLSVTIDPHSATLTFHETVVMLQPTGQTVKAHL